MKKIQATLLAALCALPGFAADSVSSNDSLVFTTVIANPVTPIKNQNNSGTCWSYSALAFLESEVIKKDPKKKDIDLCESFLVSKTYTDRADRNVRTHGDASFSQGGSFYDAIFCMDRYGLIPEGLMPYPNTLYGDSLFNFTAFFPPMEAYIHAISKSDAKKINPIWKKNVQSMLDGYFGECPTEFTYKGVKYTPKSFVKDYLKLDPNDYVSLTSYTHHPFYSSFILEIQDNWRWASSYNLPLDEFMRVMDEAVKNGWTFAWGADVSEEGFSRRTGKNRCVATVPDTKATAGVGSDQSRWTGEKAGAKISQADAAGEKVITQEMRQEGYDNWTTTDDHGMQIYGIAKDQTGKEYFMMKNSWGEYGPYKGFWYVSKPYVAYKTMNIIINKNAIPKDIRKKLGI
ncbi:MAG: C1 family peptidase [Bacteroidales bacterium]|nr:C1 family peptidase [Bacteroidales bacterium]MDY2704391.1 C1 family peptidase [Alloprevotella sp.]